MTNAPRIVAEVGCNHQGEFEIAKEMITVAAMFCKVDYVKFQKRNNRELLTRGQYGAPHPAPAHAFGVTYGQHREFLEFDFAQHRALKAECERLGVGYACSTWDVSSAKEVVALSPVYVKVPSGSNQHYELLAFLCDQFGGDIHVSLGMTTRQEEERLIRFIEQRGRAKSLVIYACTSGYPVSFEDVNLLEIDRLKESYASVVKEIGFSGHHLGIAVDAAAQVLGATWIERHFTLDRTWKGTDHAASLEPDGMRKLVRNSRAVAASLGVKKSEILDVEAPQRAKLKWGV